MKVYVVIIQQGWFDFKTHKIFDSEEKAEKYCKIQNRISKPEFDSYGWVSDGGPNYTYYSMELE